ncbi:cytochrome P450 [Syncephalastrum racemosum]|uniref:Cytochrome P450 n=1 Tax=Syncephalastrum racemosum TaxID=13706 RepID=A0A1X2HBN6_SYNRA|nr:cytochrome P450 [Syncephalastrum racemosum]
MLSVHMLKYAKALIVTRLPGGRPTAAVLTLLLALKVIQHYTARHKKAIKNLQEIPSPPGAIPYFGHLPALKSVFLIPEWQKKCGPIMRVHMGVQPWIFVSDARLAHELFASHGAITSGRPYLEFTVDYYAKNQRGLGVAPYGKMWKNLRTLALDILSPRSVDKFTPILQGGADRLIDTLLETSQVDGVNPVSALHFTAVNFMLNVCVGAGATSTDDPLFLEVEHVVVTLLEMGGVNHDVSGFLPIFKIYYWLTGKNKQYSNVISNIRDPLFHKLLKMAVESEQDCLFKTVCEKRHEYGIENDDDILVFLNDLINGGSDTTAVTLSWQIAIMCHYPDVQAKIRAEVDAFLAKHHRYPTFHERDQFAYLISVHKECLRFRPTSLFGLMHATSEDFICQNYFIPKGSVLVSSMWNMHRDPERYPQPDEFKPERFMDNTKTMSASANGGIDRRDQFNFGWGRRICPGIYLAQALVLTNDRQKLTSLASIAGATITLLVALGAVRAARKRSKEDFKEIPSAPGSVPYFGHLPRLKDIFIIPEWQKKCGPLMRVNMGVQQWVFISDPQLAHEIFVTHGAITSDRPYTEFLMDYYARNSRGLSMAPYGKKWKNTRMAALDVLSPKFIDNYNHVLVAEADRLVDHFLEAKVRGGINPISALHFASMSVILSICVGTRAESLDDPLFQEMEICVTELMKMAGAGEDVSAFLPVSSAYYWLTGRKKKYLEAIKKKRDPLFERLLATAVTGDNDCLFKSVYEKKDQYGLEEDDILVFLNDMIGGGTDTTAVTLTWQIAILCHHPDVQAKIRAEVDAFLIKHRRYPTFRERDQFPYLLSVHKECLRLRPTGPFGLTHLAKEDFTCRDYLIPKGTVLVSNMLSMHKNAERYPEPEQFKPERFIDNLKTLSASANGSIDTRDLYAFGWGRRICPGIYLAENDMFNKLIRIFARCIIEPDVDPQGKPVYPDIDGMKDGGLVVMPNDYTVRFVKRSDAVSF